MFQRLIPVAALVCACVLLAPLGAEAQDERRFEAFGSFSYLISDVGDVAATVDGPGFTGEFAFFLNDWFGIGVEGGYNSGAVDIPEIPGLTFDIDVSQWTLVFGPRFRIAGTDRFRVGAQTMAGVARAKFSLEFGLGGGFVPLFGEAIDLIDIGNIQGDVSETGFVALFGMHFDLDVGERLVWRVVQPDLLVTAFGDDTQTHFRISTGLGFEF